MTATMPPAPAGAADDRTASRERARVIADAIAERLRDPAAVAARVTADGGPARDGFAADALGEGHAGVALLFAELAADTAAPRAAAWRAAAHAHLTTAVSRLAVGPADGLYTGPPAIAFAARAARRTPQDYAALLARLNPLVRAQARRILVEDAARVDHGHAGVPVRVYDVTRGLAGIGRLLLRGLEADPPAKPNDQPGTAPATARLLSGRPAPAQPYADPTSADLTRAVAARAMLDLTAHQVLAYLVRLSAPIELPAGRVPGCYTPEPPGLGQAHAYPRGHLNLGLAHGIAGPLALLAIAWRAGVRVAGQDEAIARLAGLLLDWRDDAGRWPAAIGLDPLVAGPARADRPAAARTGWCYGEPGVCRALWLAGQALDRADWRDQAVDALHAALLNPRQVSDHGLCHGLAGLLHIAMLMAADSGDERLLATVPRLADAVAAGYDPSAPFGYRWQHPAPSRDAAGAPGEAQPPDRAGFLDGAAGIALALHGYATGRPAVTGWPAALLLA